MKDEEKFHLDLLFTTLNGIKEHLSETIEDAESLGLDSPGIDAKVLGRSVLINEISSITTALTQVVLFLNRLQSDEIIGLIGKEQLAAEVHALIGGTSDDSELN